MNAKQEFLAEVKGKDVLCAEIKRYMGYDAVMLPFLLPIGYSSAFYDEFIDSLDFRYDDGFGGQELFGTIWYTDGSWSERGAYDGSEWWEHKVCPEVPECLKKE